MANYYYYKKKVNKNKLFRDVLYIYIITITFVLLFNSILLQAYKIPSDSMEPVISENSQILVDKFSTGPRYPFTNLRIFNSEENIQRGDVIVFMSKEYYSKSSFLRAFSNLLYTVSFTLVDINRLFSISDNTFMVKRVIGLPGDRIMYYNRDDSIRVLINGKPEKEVINLNYEIIEENTSNSLLLDAVILEKEYIVPPNQVYVLGDNRVSSSDSRIWGSIYYKQIIGKAFFTYWPFSKFSIIR